MEAVLSIPHTLNNVNGHKIHAAGYFDGAENDEKIRCFFFCTQYLMCDVEKDMLVSKAGNGIMASWHYVGLRISELQTTSIVLTRQQTLRAAQPLP